MRTVIEKMFFFQSGKNDSFISLWMNLWMNKLHHRTMHSFHYLVRNVSLREIGNKSLLRLNTTRPLRNSAHQSISHSVCLREKRSTDCKLQLTLFLKTFSISRIYRVICWNWRRSRRSANTPNCLRCLLLYLIRYGGSFEFCEIRGNKDTIGTLLCSIRLYRSEFSNTQTYFTRFKN